MKKFFALALIIFASALVHAQTRILPSTAFSRSLLRAENAATARGLIGATNTGLVNVTSYGAVADGITADDAAFSNALLNANQVYVPRGVYRLTKPIILGGGKTLVGDGRSTVLFIDANTNAIGMTNYTFASGVKDVTILGTKAGTNQIGILTPVNGYNFHLDNVTVSNCWTGIRAQQNALLHVPSRISNADISDCYNGIVTDEHAEYISITSPTIHGCTNGMIIQAGNTAVSAAVITDCATNVFLKSGSNDSHGVISGSLLNHATEKGIVTEGIANGFKFVGCYLFNNSYDLQGTNIQFLDCTFGQSPLTFNITNCAHLFFDGVTFKDVTFPTINASNSDYLIRYFDTTTGKMIQRSTEANTVYGLSGTSPYLEFSNGAGVRMGYVQANAGLTNLTFRSDLGGGFNFANSVGATVFKIYDNGNISSAEITNKTTRIRDTSPFLDFLDDSSLRVGFVQANTATKAMVFKNAQTNGFSFLDPSSVEIASIQTNSISLGTAAVKWIVGSGSPESVVAAPIGSFYSRSDGGAGTSFYVKQSGTGNTGWVAK